MLEKTLSVSQLNKYVAMVLSQDPIVSDVKISGEISNYKKNVSGHLYFTLKDEQSSIRCVMFKTNAQNVDFELENGQNIIVEGYVSIYARDGQYQLYATHIKKIGETKGMLFEKFEKLKQKLELKGYFDENKKPKISQINTTVAVITSPTGAVLHDIIKVINRNMPCNIFLCEASVQGEKAKHEIVSAIELCNKVSQIDVIILARGGGSIEDLWAFNEEIVANAIHKSKKPIISAVGHQTDFTIADFVATLRAPTPSAAAEMVTMSKQNLRGELNYYYEKISNSMRAKIDRQVSKNNDLKQKLYHNSPKNKLENIRQQLDFENEKLISRFKKNIESKKAILKNNVLRLESVNPLTILQRGFATIYKNKTLIKSTKQVAKNDKIEIRFYDGEISATIN